MLVPLGAYAWWLTVERFVDVKLMSMYEYDPGYLLLDHSRVLRIVSRRCELLYFRWRIRNMTIPTWGSSGPLLDLELACFHARRCVRHARRWDRRRCVHKELTSFSNFASDSKIAFQLGGSEKNIGRIAR